MKKLLVWAKTLLAKIILIIEFCDSCGSRQHLVWTTTDENWAEITGAQDGGGVYCPRCFDTLAEKKGISLRWVPLVDYRIDRAK